MKKYQVPTIEIIKAMPMLLQFGSPGGSGTSGTGQLVDPSLDGEGNAAPWRY